MAGVPTYAPEEAPQWVHDVVENLQREHDTRVEEYIALEKMLPAGKERAAIHVAINALRESGHGYVADILDGYIKRLAANPLG
jgi:hypothetical protein